MKLTVKDLYDLYGESLELETTQVQKGMKNLIKAVHVQRPGLSLAGFSLRKKDHRILIFGRGELSYLRTLDSSYRLSRLEKVITSTSPVVIIARNLSPPREMIQLCQNLGIPIFRTSLRSMALMSKLTMILSDVFAPSTKVHGTLIEAYGMGVLIQGDSSVGKSEAALGLIERGHRLISDDVVQLKGKEGRILMGSGPSLNKHLLELRGIGIVNVAHLFGAVSVRGEAAIDIVIQLEDWDETHYYDRIGLEERFIEFLEIKVPLYLNSVKPGRDSVLLIEATILNHRLKEMGYHSAKEFNLKLLEEIARKKDVGRKS